MTAPDSGPEARLVTREQLAAALASLDWGDYTITNEVTTEQDAPNRVFESSVDMEAFAAAILYALPAAAPAEGLLDEDKDFDGAIRRIIRRLDRALADHSVMCLARDEVKWLLAALARHEPAGEEDSK